MRDFLSDLFHFLVQIVMWLPCHPFRRLMCKMIMKSFDTSSSVRRKVELRSPQRIVIGKKCNINKNTVLDGRQGLVISVDQEKDIEKQN